MRFIIKNSALKIKNAGKYRYEIVLGDEKVKSEKATAEFGVKL